MIRKNCQRIGFDRDATELFVLKFNELLKDADVFNGFMKASVELLSGVNVKDSVTALSEKCGIHPFTLLDILLVYTVPALEHTYDRLGISHLFSGFLDDIRAKTVECKNVYGIWGNICYDWYIGFYKCERFCFGRLQLEKRSAKYAFDRWQEKERVINCHIPSTGPLKYDDCIESFKMAYEFFADVRRDGILPIVCSSWLLHPPTAKCYKPGSNLESFYNMFKVIHHEDTEKNHNFWRVFNCEYKDKDKAPLDTSLRRNIMEMLDSGQNMGAGYGILLFDGEKIIK